MFHHAKLGGLLREKVTTINTSSTPNGFNTAQINIILPAVCVAHTRTRTDDESRGTMAAPTLFNGTQP